MKKKNIYNMYFSLSFQRLITNSTSMHCGEEEDITYKRKNLDNFFYLKKGKETLIQHWNFRMFTPKLYIFSKYIAVIWSEYLYIFKYSFSSSILVRRISLPSLQLCVSMWLFSSYWPNEIRWKACRLAGILLEK